MKKIIFTSLIFTLSLCLLLAVGISASADGTEHTEHIWEKTDEGTLCTVCNTLVPYLSLPDFEFSNKTVYDLSELGFDHATLRGAVPADVEMIFDNGVLSVTDSGFKRVWFNTFSRSDLEDMTFNSNGTWTVEITEEDYLEGGVLYVYLDEWEISYRYGDLEHLYYDPSDTISVIVYDNQTIVNYENPATPEIYSIQNEYDANGDLVLQELSSSYNGASITADYTRDGELESFCVYKGGWYYYLADSDMWSLDYTTSSPCDPPEGFENMTEDEMKEALPNLLPCDNHDFTPEICGDMVYCKNCYETDGVILAHDWIGATCTAPKTCERCNDTEGNPLGHLWTNADCTTPISCERCDATEGEPLYHNWLDATCISPKTCDRCGTTEGEPLEQHDWREATCTTPKTCKICETTEGDPLPHDWKDATCTSAKRCKNCSTTEGEPLGHSWVDATCTERKTCTVCNKTQGKALGHTSVDTEAVAPTCTEAGLTAGSVCSVCNKKLSGREAVSALGHSYDNDCDSSCNTCLAEREVGEHTDSDGDKHCDKCDYKKPMGAGAIILIVAGSLVGLGGAGFAVYYFLIKKRAPKLPEEN